MTNKTEQELLEQAVAEAAALPIPTQEEQRKPLLCEQASMYKGTKNLFRPGRKNKAELIIKLDSEGKEVLHGNGGYVYTKK